MDRRGFLRRAGAMAALTGAAALGAACSPTGSRSATTTSAPVASEPPTAEAWAALAASLSGRLVRPGDPGYGAARLVYDLRYADTMPAAVAYCASPADVQRCIAFARDHDVPITARSGGHSYGGYSTGSGLVVDVTPMSAVSVAAGPGAPTATVGSGALLVDLYDRLAGAGVLVPGGSCPTVGIAGLTLGGGIGVVGRHYGLTCDNVAELEIVTADGLVRRCNPADNRDLLWACQGGGGGNFGIVTSFTFDVHPMPDLALFTLEWPWAAAADVLGAWLEWAPDAPDELWSNCQLLSAGADGVEVRCTGVLVGDTATLDQLLAPFVGAVGAAPTDRFVGPEAYLRAMLIEAGCQDRTVAQCHMPEQNAAGTLSRSAFAATSAYVSTTMPAAGVQAAVELVGDLRSSQPDVGGGLVFDAYGGAINRVAPDATAFVHRSARCAIQSTVSWGPSPSPAALSLGRSWLDHGAAALAPYTDGGAYQNYIDPTLGDWQRAYYGANFERLVRVKAVYDPDDVFHFAQSIPTGTGR